MALIGCLFATAVQISRYISSTVWIFALTTPIPQHNTADGAISMPINIYNTVVLGIAQFGGAGEDLYLREFERFKEKYETSIIKEEFEVLNQHTQNSDLLAQDVISLAERIVTPHTVFTVMPFRFASDEVFHFISGRLSTIGFRGH